MLKTILTTLCCLFLWATFAVAQSDTGAPSYQAMFPVSPYETVNLGNLNVLIHAPVRSKSGPIPLHFEITYDVQVFRYHTTGGDYFDSTIDPGLSPIPQPAMFTGYGGHLSSTMSSPTCGGQQDSVLTITGVVDGNQTVHPIPTVHWDWLGCLYGSSDVFTTDNSGYELVVPAGTGNPNITYPLTTVYDRNGFAVDSSSTVSDPHNNSVSTAVNGAYTATVTDPLTSTPVLSYPWVWNNFQFGQTQNYTYTDGTGTQRNVVATTTSHALNTSNYACSGMITYSNPTIAPLTSINFPDGSSLSLTYEKNGSTNLDGRLATVVVPTGATYTHSYSGGTNNQGVWCNTPVSQSPVATMTVSNGTGTWTFARTIGSGTTTTTTVTKPDGSVTVYTFVGDIITNKVTKDMNGSTVLDTLTYCFDSTISTCNSSVPTQHPTWVRAYRTVPGVSSNAETDTKYDTNGNVLEVDRYDFGPTLVNKTLTTYGTWNGSSCASLSSIHIESLPCDVQVQDSGSNVLKHSRFSYNTTNGNLLTEYDYTGSSRYLTTSNTYNSNGTLATHAAADGVQTTFGNSQCNGFLPDHATTSIGTASMAWDCNLAKPLSTTDLNSLTTYYAYNDPLNRPTAITDNGGQVGLGYIYTSPTQFTVGMSLFNSGNSIVSTTTNLNSLGQVVSKQRATAPGGTTYDTVSYTYDSTGHLKTTSQPCTVALGTACSLTAVTYTYDGMNRPLTVKTNTSTNGVLTYSYPNGDVKAVLSPAPTGENNKTVQIERDGLGRTVRSCAVTTLSGSGSCGERASGSGYLTLNTLDGLGRATQISHNAQTGGTAVNSTFVFDMASRITSATLPESGTATYVYDTTTSNCAGSLAGHLTQSNDSNGDGICHGYDSMGRPAYITYFSGLSGVTPQKYFSYDSGGQGSHLVGRLATAFTCYSPCTTHQTNYNFGYDIYGRLTDVFQNTPLVGAGNWYHTSATFWDNGALASLSGVPGLATFNYGLDGEGRPYTTTSGSGTYVSSVAYDSANNPTGIDYGNSDSDAYAWDPVTGNMTQYLFSVGTGSNNTDYASLTWNPNGTLKQLAITDKFNSSDTQTCNTAHDDLVRITSFNCGSIFNESYAYSSDYAGNVIKSGTISFAPGYNPANNQFLSPYTYAPTGNMLHDGTLGNTYAWDSEGALYSVNGQAFVNDAFNRNVEPNSATDILYSPVGRIGWVGGLSSPIFINMPLAGGSSVTFGSGVVAQLEHYDFKGNVRLTSGFASRSVNQVFAYGPSGEAYITTPSSNQVVEGAWQDSTTNMFDFGTGRSVPITSRWVNPIGGANGYVKNNSPF